ncbi:hypothetical protein [Cutibacterium namnetense]|uniref:Uncharacterized protein n=1 Tax=Cutibacterium namnetense TaxID=1574624 RepID=A0ABX9IC76_9ACTN|nr:hypothetical protein [Cutibacterium namnetense]REB70991.1 hypothetical protein CP880_04660 [Cutibacterium namnetense]
MATGEVKAQVAAVSAATVLDTEWRCSALRMDGSVMWTSHLSVGAGRQCLTRSRRYQRYVGV